MAIVEINAALPVTATLSASAARKPAPLPLLRGATAVRAAVVNYLTVVVPEIVDQARVDWGLDEYQLPYPVKYDAYEPYALDRWPLIGVNVATGNSFTRYQYTRYGSNQYMSQYAVRVFTWVRTPMDEDQIPLEPGYSESIRLRDDLTACVRAALLRSGCLSQPDAILFDEASLTEDYSEATGVKGSRFVAGVIHSFNIRYDETVALVGLGSTDTIELETQLIDENLQVSVSLETG